MSQGTITGLIQEIEYLSKHSVEIGILAVDKERKGSNNEVTILEYAVYNEFGTKDIPARPFIRNAIESNEEVLNKYIEKRMEEVLDSKITGRVALMQIGKYIRGLIIQSIATATSWATPLSSKTLKAKLKKGSNNDKTLIEDRFLIRSIRYQIVSKKGKIDYLSDFKEV